MDYVRRLIAPLFPKFVRCIWTLIESDAWIRLEVLKDWNLLTRQLQEEIDKGEVADSRLNIAIQVIDCCASMIADDSLHPAGGGRKRKQDDKEKLRQDMSCIVMDLISPWIHEFQLEKTKVRCCIAR